MRKKTPTSAKNSGLFRGHASYPSTAIFPLCHWTGKKRSERSEEKAERQFEKELRRAEEEYESIVRKAEKEFDKLERHAEDLLQKAEKEIDEIDRKVVLCSVSFSVDPPPPGQYKSEVSGTTPLSHTPNESKPQTCFFLRFMSMQSEW